MENGNTEEAETMTNREELITMAQEVGGIVHFDASGRVASIEAFGTVYGKGLNSLVGFAEKVRRQRAA
jgi:hypothetical protein